MKTEVAARHMSERVPNPRCFYHDQGPCSGPLSDFYALPDEQMVALRERFKNGAIYDFHDRTLRPLYPGSPFSDAMLREGRVDYSLADLLTRLRIKCRECGGHAEVPVGVELDYDSGMYEADDVKPCPACSDGTATICDGHRAQLEPGVVRHDFSGGSKGVEVFAPTLTLPENVQQFARELGLPGLVEAATTKGTR